MPWREEVDKNTIKCFFSLEKRKFLETQRVKINFVRTEKQSMRLSLKEGTGNRRMGTGNRKTENGKGERGTGNGERGTGNL